jgi:hypothetical protein
VTIDDSGSSKTIVSVGPNLKDDVVTISVSLPVRLTGCWHHTACTLQSSLRLGSIPTTTFLVSLALDYWTQVRLGSRLSREAYQHRCGGLLYNDPLIRPNVAQHADPSPEPVLYVLPHRYPYLNPLLLLLNPLSPPTKPPWSPPPCI